jgi:hypothetical protein
MTSSRPDQHSLEKSYYYLALQVFRERAASQLSHGAVHAVLQPQQQDHGVPEFQAQQKNPIIGWVARRRWGLD